MKKLILLLLLAAVGYTTYSYFARAKNELELHTQVKKFLTRVPHDAGTLDASHMRELEDILLQHSFKLLPDSVSLSTARTEERPLAEAGNQNLFVKHTLLYSYKRPQTFLPFNTEVHQVKETQLVEIPGSAPKIGGTNLHQSRMIQQSMNFSAVQQPSQQQAQAQADALRASRAQVTVGTSPLVQTVDPAKLRRQWEKEQEKLRKKAAKAAKKAAFRKKHKSSIRWKD